MYIRRNDEVYKMRVFWIEDTYKYGQIYGFEDPIYKKLEAFFDKYSQREMVDKFYIPLSQYNDEYLQIKNSK